MERSPILEKLERRYRYFPLFVALYEVLGLLSLVFICVWTGVWAGGWGWYGTSAQFNVHPVLMMLGLTFFHGNGMLVFRVLRNQSLKLVKIIHLTCMAIAFLCVFIGLIAVFQFHSWLGVGHLYSIHSWVGFCVVILFVIQFCLGVTAFMLPCTESSSFGEALLPIHTFGGVTIYIGACCAMVIGIYERIYILLSTDYSTLGAEGAVANTLALSTGFTAVALMYVLYKDAWKRREAKTITIRTREERSEPERRGRREGLD